MSFARPTDLGLQQDVIVERRRGKAACWEKAGSSRAIARCYRHCKLNGQAWIGSTVDLSGFGYIADAGSLRRHLGEWNSEVKTLSHLTCSAPARRGWRRVEHATFPQRTCVAGNAGSPKLAGLARSIWRRSSHSTQRRPAIGSAGGNQPAPSQRHKSTTMAMKPIEVGGKGNSSWCGQPKLVRG
jgi:hypothetical protein